MDNVLPEPERELEFEVKGNKVYEVKAIINSMVDSQQTNDSNQMSGLYYLVLWKGYLEKKNTWELLLAVIHLWKLISTFHKEYSEKLIVISPPLDSAWIFREADSNLSTFRLCFTNG